MIGEVTDEELPPLKRQALEAAPTILLDQFFDDVSHLLGGAEFADTHMSRYLPAAFKARYTGLFAKQFLTCLATVALKLVLPGNWQLASVGEELALHALVEQAEAVLEAAGEDADLDDFRELATEDWDCLLLFDLRFDGIEDSEVASQFGMANLRFHDWFKPFRDSVPVHPYLIT